MSDLIKQNFELRKENEKLRTENKLLKDELKKTQNALSYANNRIKQLEKQFDDYKAKEEERIKFIVEKAVKQITEKLEKEHKKETDKLNDEINRLKRRLNIDSTNSGTPTSKETIGKHTIQNNREKSNKPRGGQKGHKANKLAPFKEEEITNKVIHTLDVCPDCGGKLEEKNIAISDVIDVEVIVTKTRNEIHNYKCSKCHKNVSANKKLPRGTSYGENIQAISTSMMNEANTPLNKIASFFKGVTNNEISLTEGYLEKLQKRNAKRLDEFNHDLKEKILDLKNVFWDDTVAKIGIDKPAEGYDDKDLDYLEKLSKDEEKKNKKTRNCIIRFYGDNNWALLIGHRQKDEESIEADGILENLPADCTVMHDHVLLNYNDKYNFKNAECNEHIRRALKKNMDMFPEHKWAKELREYLTNLNKNRNKDIEKGIEEYPEKKIEEIFDKYKELIKLGYEENNKVGLENITNKNEELKLISRLDTFKENHLLFIKDFSVAFTNNTSERGLRQVKRKLAVSFMFKNANRMKDYAKTVSYLETCYRNGISRYDAAKRLAQANPYTVKEISEIIEANNKKEGEKN